MTLSQAYQDIFAKTTAKVQTYIEIGARKPSKYNNTCLLEENGWNGFSIEIDQKFQKAWSKERKNKIYFSDALLFDYYQGCIKNNMTTRIGYLSCDIEPPLNTFTALQRVINQGMEFDCITFEHDDYQSKENYNEIATNYLISKGYKVAVHGVYFGRHSHFETWYVKNDIDFLTVSFDEWKKNVGITK